MNIKYIPTQFNEVRVKLPDGCQDVIIFVRNVGSVAGHARMTRGFYNYGIGEEDGWHIYGEGDFDRSTQFGHVDHYNLEVIAWQEIPKVEFEDMPQ